MERTTDLFHQVNDDDDCCDDNDDTCSLYITITIMLLMMMMTIVNEIIKFNKRWKARSTEAVAMTKMRM